MDLQRVQVNVGDDQPKKLKNELKASQAEASAEQQPIKKVRRKKGLESGSPFDFPKEMIPDGVDFCWVLESCHGQEFMHITNAFMLDGAWEPVTTDMWGGRFANRWTAVGYKGAIHYGGQVLCWRPIEFTIEARQEEREAALAPILQTRREIKKNQVPGMTLEGKTLQAAMNTSLTETFAAIPD